jgi:hypothetical protein
MKKLTRISILLMLALIILSSSCHNKFTEDIISRTELPEPDPSNRWGVFSGGDISKQSHPLIKGVGIRMNWRELEPVKGEFKFPEILGPQLEKAHENDFNTYLMIWVGPAKTQAPMWLFESGVPIVHVVDDVNPLGQPRVDNYFAYYLNEDYTFYYHRLMREFGKYVSNLPIELRERVLFIQSAEGSTGDGQPYKSVPKDPQYNISHEEWNVFRRNVWTVMNESLTNDKGEALVPILVNFDANTEEEKQWLMDNFTVIGAKQGMFSHGYHISDTQKRLEDWKKFKSDCKERGIETFVRGEQDAEWETYGWSTQNKAQGLYWSGIFALNCGVDMWNLPTKAALYDDAVIFFNRHAAQHEPAEAKAAFCALRKGLDASNTTAYPESVYGPATRSNIDRYLKIADAYKMYGAMQGDPEKAIGAGMVNRKRQDYNDVGWKILEGNYYQHLTQIDPETTSTGWWHKGPKESIYSRFARSTNTSKGNALFFDLDDDFYKGNKIFVRVVWLDEGNSEWELLYDAVDKPEKTAFSVTNSNSGQWMEKIVEISDALLNNRGEKGADFIIRNKSDEEAVFHLVEIVKKK